jgi:hypothetical protein
MLRGAVCALMLLAVSACGGKSPPEPAASAKSAAAPGCPPVLVREDDTLGVACRTDDTPAPQLPLRIKDLTIHGLGVPAEAGRIDVRLSNVTARPVVVRRVVLAMLGHANVFGCNPGPVATLRFRLDLNLLAAFRGEGPTAARVRHAATGAFEHQYCDGYMMTAYPHEFTIRPGEEAPYSIDVTGGAVRYLGAYPMPRDFPADQPIPRLDVPIRALDEMAAAGLWPGKGITVQAVLGGARDPGYTLPLWRSAFVLLVMEDGTILAGKSGADGRVSAFGGIDRDEAKSDDLLRDLDAIDLPRSLVEPILAFAWK